MISVNIAAGKKRSVHVDIFNAMVHYIYILYKYIYILLSTSKGYRIFVKVVMSWD